MDLTDAIIDYRRFLKRKNYSAHTVKNTINRLKHFVVWLPVPLEQTVYGHLKQYIEMLMNKRRSPVTINCHLASIRGFFDYLHDEGQLCIVNPVKKGCGVRVSHPLPRYLKEEQIDKLFAVITRLRDRAMFKLMLRCGLRVEEVAKLTTDAVDLGKGLQEHVHQARHGIADGLAAEIGRRGEAFFLEKKKRGQGMGRRRIAAGRDAHGREGKRSRRGRARWCGG